MEKEYRIKSETARSIMGKIPHGFLVKGIFLACLTLSMVAYLLSVVTVPVYKEYRVHVIDQNEDGELYGVVIVSKTQNPAMDYDHIRINRHGSSKPSTATIKESFFYGNLGVIHIGWRDDVKNTAAKQEYLASFVENNKPIIFYIFEPKI